MLPVPVHEVSLACHPDSPTDVVRAIAARVQRQPAESLAITYVVDGDVGRLRVPAPREPRPAERLWQHTCCEIFIARKGSASYHEINLSPSGEWAAYAFDGYRALCSAGAHARQAAPTVEVRRTGCRLELDALIRLDRLAASYAGAPLSLALSAVIEAADGALSYWALRHPPGKPDFHHRQAFALELAEGTE